jgi:hypothetical protein
MTAPDAPKPFECEYCGFLIARAASANVRLRNENEVQGAQIRRLVPEVNAAEQDNARLRARVSGLLDEADALRAQLAQLAAVTEAHDVGDLADIKVSLQSQAKEIAELSRRLVAATHDAALRRLDVVRLEGEVATAREALTRILETGDAPGSWPAHIAYDALIKIAKPEAK